MIIIIIEVLWRLEGLLELLHKVHNTPNRIPQCPICTHKCVHGVLCVCVCVVYGVCVCVCVCGGGGGGGGGLCGVVQ